MINKKKFYLNLTKNLIKLNPLRSLLLLLAFILVYVSTIVPNTIYFLNVNNVFLNWFIKNPTCEYVEVKFETIYTISL